jgi:hypothetical protein
MPGLPVPAGFMLMISSGKLAANPFEEKGIIIKKTISKNEDNVVLMCLVGIIFSSVC